MFRKQQSVHPWGMNEGVNIPPRGQSELLGANSTPGVKLMLLKTGLREPMLYLGMFLKECYISVNLKV
jgi:hypothetical protein